MIVDLQEMLENIDGLRVPCSDETSLVAKRAHEDAIENRKFASLVGWLHSSCFSADVGQMHFLSPAMDCGEGDKRWL
jgi:hypothetical protein